MKVDVYDKDGRYLRTAVWEIGDGAYGPRVDGRGNLYFAMGVACNDGNVPKVFKSIDYYGGSYGSIVKFPPAGGALWFSSPRAYAANFGFPRPELRMPKQEVYVIRGPRMYPDGVLQGAQWWRPGFSVYQDLSRSPGGPYCHCNGQSFDVDPYGRIFYPDMLRFRIVVLDSNGNEILHFGGYGNCDQRGTYSWLRDSKDGGLRPPASSVRRRMAPFGDPPFAFAFLNGIAVGEDHLYVTDTLNQRLLKIRLEYEDQAACPISSH